MMSGAGSLLYFHLGVVKAMSQQGLMPDVLSGSSGGAFVGGLMCSHNDDELQKILEPENLAYEVDEETGPSSIFSALTPSFMSIVPL